ncbi:MAG: hypothetical protein L3J05_06485 [Robiginitomaculum sp.]|nr:hypothetical protein [Robiginitomaculum sp.]
MSTNDQSLKALWQNLPSETVVFTNEQMRSRATKFQAKHKRRDITEYIGYVGLFGLVAYMLTVRADWQAWVSSGLVVVGAIIAMWNYYRLARVKSKPSLNSGDSLLEFMRRALKRQRDAAASAWRWYILPFTPTILFIIAYRWVEEGSTITELTEPRISILLTTALMIAFFSAALFWQFLCAARYQRQLDDLDRYVRK